MNNDKSIEIIKDKSDKWNFSFTDNKSVFYTALFYSLGLFIGAYFYKLAKSDKLNDIVALKDGSFINLFLSDFCIFFSVFLVSVFLGFCLIGKPVIYAIPVLFGSATGLRIAYYFIEYSAKGVGYSLIMIVPYTALFITVISYTIDNSSRLSTRLIELTKGEGDKNFELSPYLKKYLICSSFTLITALLDSGLTKLLFYVVTI